MSTIIRYEATREIGDGANWFDVTDDYLNSELKSFAKYIELIGCISGRRKKITNEAVTYYKYPLYE